MMKKPMRLISAILCLCLLLAVVPFGMFTASAETCSGKCGTNLTWVYDRSAYTLTVSGTGEMQNYAYDAPWATYSDEIAKVVIDDGVTTIGQYAFYCCFALTDVVFGNSLLSIGDYAFNECSSLTAAAIPDSVTKIGESAFNGCQMMLTLTIGSGVTEIGNWAFGKCVGLYSITVDPSNRVYHSDGNCIIQTEMKTLVCGCKASVIPEDGSVTAIGNYAFYECWGMISMTIPNTVTYIGEEAFYWCTGLESLTIGSGVETIDDHAFFGCKQLTDVTVPDSVVNIGEAVFAACDGLVSMAVQSGNRVYHSAGNCIIKTAAKTLVCGCKASVIPEDGSVTAIGNSAFIVCEELTDISIPDTVSAIGTSAFELCQKLTDISIPDSVVSIGNFAFFWSGITDVYYGGSIVDRKYITVGKENDALSLAVWHYAKPHTHAYENVVTKATLSKNGRIVPTCVCDDVKSATVIYKPATFTLSTPAYAYNGKVRTPTVTVKDAAGKTIAASNYTVTYASGRKAVGTYSVKITFKGNYTGTKTLSFKILPAKVAGLKATQTASSVKLSWNKSAGAKTYKIYTYNASTETYTKIGSTASTSFTKTGLRSGKVYTYYVRACNGSYGSAGLTKIVTATKPAKPKVTVVPGSRRATVSWKKVSGATGYQVYYSAAKSGGYRKVAATTALKVTQKSLKKGRTYYFLVRSYKKVGSTCYFSGWVTKSVKIK